MKINSNKLKSIFLLSLVGSNLAKEEKTNNHLNSLPQIGTNFTSSKITQRDSEHIYVAGTPALFNVNAINGVASNKCTGGFAIVNTNVSTCVNGNDYGGFVASVFCNPSEPGSSLSVTSWDGSLVLGKLLYGYSPGRNGVDYNYVSSRNTVNLQLLPFVPKTTEEGTDNLLPVVALTNPLTVGSEICVYGAISGYKCGSLTAVQESLNVPNPYNIPDRPWPIGYLGKVDLGTNGLLKEDIGAPVYTETQIGERTLAQAVGHVSVIDNNDVQHQSFYYTPLEWALLAIQREDNCTYSLLTYNENNTQEYDQLIAQVEIPTKK